MDPTGHDALYRWLAYGHPVWMATALAIAGLALRLGLELRRGRQARRPRSPARCRLHARLGRTAVVLIAGGFGAGPLSMALLRGRQPFGTAHALTGAVAAALFLGVWLLGRSLERGRSRSRDAHAILALVASLAAAVSFVTGFVLLP